MKIEMPVKRFPDNTYWVLIDKGITTNSVIFRANKIIKNKKRPMDYDGHHCDEASAEGSIKCRAKSYFINDKIFKK